MSSLRAPMPAPLADEVLPAVAQYDAEGNPLNAPMVPNVAPPVSTDQCTPHITSESLSPLTAASRDVDGKLPSAPLTASPDAAPENYAQISNVMLPGVAAPDPGGYMEQQAQGMAPPPPRPDMLPPPP
jgi:hypothetical protein